MQEEPDRAVGCLEHLVTFSRVLGETKLDRGSEHRSVIFCIISNVLKTYSRDVHEDVYVMSLQCTMYSTYKTRCYLISLPADLCTIMGRSAPTEHPSH